jgi:hypothetical protein
MGNTKIVPGVRKYVMSSSYSKIKEYSFTKEILNNTQCVLVIKRGCSKWVEISNIDEASHCQESLTWYEFNARHIVFRYLLVGIYFNCDNNVCVKLNSNLVDTQTTNYRNEQNSIGIDGHTYYIEFNLPEVIEHSIVNSTDSKLTLNDEITFIVPRKIKYHPQILSEEVVYNEMESLELFSIFFKESSSHRILRKIIFKPQINKTSFSDVEFIFN